MTSGEAWPWTQIITGGFTLAGSAVGALFTFLMTRNKHARDKTWEMRVEIYSQIVASLKKVESIGAVVENAYAEDPFEADSSEWCRARQGDLWTAYSAAGRLYDEHLLLLSDDFAKRVDALRAAVAAVDEDDYPPIRHTAFMTAIREHLPAIAEQGKLEVRP